MSTIPASCLFNEISPELTDLSTENGNTFTRLLAFFSIPKGIFEYIAPVDLNSIWRRHLVWSKKNGDDLLKINVARYTSTTVFLSLLVSAEVSTFFSPSNVVEKVRQAIQDPDQAWTLNYITGITLLVSIFISIAALVANLTAWHIFLVLSKENAAMILRSSMGLYAAQMPNRLVLLSIYLFFVWVVMFWWLLLSTPAAATMTAFGVALVIHIASTYSALARVIMATSAMGEVPILPKAEEEKLSPGQLFDVLIAETRLAQQAKIPVYRQYRVNYQEQLHAFQKQALRNRSLHAVDGGSHHSVKLTYRDLFVHRHPDVELGLERSNNSNGAIPSASSSCTALSKD